MYPRLLLLFHIFGIYCGYASKSVSGIFLSQNVNKVNTKAVAKWPIDSPLIPSWARENLKSTVSCFPFCHHQGIMLRFTHYQ